jgi:antigen flippase
VNDAADFASWRRRFMRLVWGGGGPIATAITGLLRNKWLALHLDTAGLGVLGQVVAGQTWLGTATGLGLGFPLTRAIGERLARNDAEGVRRAVATAAVIVGLALACAVVLVTVCAGPISTLLFGSDVHAALVRISVLGVAGLAVHGLVQGLFAGHSDLKALFTLAAVSGAAGLGVTLFLVPRFGVAGGVTGAAVLTLSGIAIALLVHRRRYAAAVFPLRLALDRPLAREMLAVAGAGLSLALIDQGALLGLRAHFLRENGTPANGLLQAALALSQQVGAPFFAYLYGYAFAKVAGFGAAEGVRAYTRRQWLPLLAAFTGAFGVAMAAASPLLHVFYSDRFDPARPMMAWMLFGEFGKLAGQTWALGALPLGGTRTWLRTGLAFPLGMLAAYPLLAAADPLTRLPMAYAAGGVCSVLAAGWVMSRRGVTPGGREIAALAVALAGLGALAAAVAR